MIKIGDKIPIPLKKTVGGTLTSSGILKSARRRNQNFLYVIKINKNIISVHYRKEDTYGDIFDISDLTLINNLYEIY